MSKVVPYKRKEYKKKFCVLCSECRSIYKSRCKLTKVGSGEYYVFKPCPECKYEYNTKNVDKISLFTYWLISKWRKLCYNISGYDDGEE